jgi:hypothetical protein
MEYTPDRWVCIEITLDDITTRHILGGWWGGYLDGDSWRMSSSIRQVTVHDNHYQVDNVSGSRYICYKTQHGFTGLSASVLENLKKQKETIVNIVHDIGGTHE